MALSEEQIRGNDGISTEEIRQDIENTQKEIDQYEIELSTLLQNIQENRIGIYMREGKITKRKVFINILNQILDYRKAKA